MRIGIIDFDSVQVNLAAMKISSFHKSLGNEVILNPTNVSQVDHVYCSTIFSWSKEKALKLAEIFPSIEFGGTGMDIFKKLPVEIENMPPDYDLYSANVIAKRLKGIMTSVRRQEKAETIVNAGIGRTATGCSRSCSFCVTPKAEGKLKSIGTLAELVNPRSRVVTLLDANLTADPDCLEKLKQAKEMGLILDITQGIDCRILAKRPDIAKALSEVKHLRSIHTAWDLMESESLVTEGIRVLSRFVSKSRQLVFMLTGYNTTHEQDMYRFHKLLEMGIDPYAMRFRGDGGCGDEYEKLRNMHFSRWVNGRIHKKCKFSEYTNWLKAQELFFIKQEQPLLLAA